jgi:hypothetical protein
MLRVLCALALISSFASPVLASTNADEIVGSSVKEVTSEYEAATVIPEFPGLSAPATDSAGNSVNSDPGTGNPSGTPTIGATIGTTVRNAISQVTLGQIITLGGKIWDFIITNRPTATFQTLQSSIVPSGITNWTQLRGWQTPVSKVYRVTFQTIFGGEAGSFDYRITFVPGGSYNGKGKFLGAISLMPMNIKLHTDRSLDMKATMSDPLNFGTELNPVAAAQLVVSWTSPTTTRYQMSSAEYFIYGTGEIQDLTNGN